MTARFTVPTTEPQRGQWFHELGRALAEDVRSRTGVLDTSADGISLFATMLADQLAHLDAHALDAQASTSRTSATSTNQGKVS